MDIATTAPSGRRSRPSLPPMARSTVRTAWWWAALVTALVLAWLQPDGMRRLDLLAYDLALPSAEPSAQAPVVLAIDDASLARLGPWPWPPALYARMIDRLADAGAASVGIAVQFADTGPRPSAGDTALATAIARYGRVALAAAPRPRSQGWLERSPALPDGPPLGHVDVAVDLDGQVRGQHLYAGLERPQVPALALAVWERAAAAGSPSLDVVPMLQRQAPGVWMRNREVFPPRMPALPVHSFADLLDSTDLTALVRGRSVFIGVTATGLGSLLASPLAPAHAQLPALQFHAQVFDALQSGNLIRPATPSAALGLALALVTALALLPRRKRQGVVPARVLLGAAVLVAPLAVSAALLQGFHLWLPPALATLAVAVALAVREAGQLRAVNLRLQRARLHTQAALHAIDDAVITIEAHRRTIRFANHSAQQQVDQAQLEGATLRQAYPLEPESHERLQHALDDCLARGHGIHVPELLHLRSPDGPRTLRATLNPLRSSAGAPPDGAVLVLSDVTGTLAAAREREHAATHDALTGLPNRVLLQQRLQLTLSRVRRHERVSAILFIDLDRFKHINDSLGHHTGDEVLKVVARRLRELCRDTDTVARWGGDEFVLILEDVGGTAGATAAAAKVVDALSQDIALGEDFNQRRLPSAASVGVVMVPRDGHQIEDLLSKADMAMYRAKTHPKASFHFWSSDLDSRLNDRLTLEVELREALLLDRFVLLYQPQYALEGGALVGMEALMRWKRTPDQLVEPSHFIQIAEESGLIIDMGAWAVREATRQIAAWQSAGHQVVPVAVNVSGRQCLGHEFVQVVRDALRDTGIAPRLLRLEITESVAMAEGDQVIDLLRDIRALGVELSLDDFGTGYSSLADLKRFPIDELKIDRSFVQALPHARDDVAIVHATIALARGLGLKVVAEGVETEEQRGFLQALQCDMAQGYFFAEPLTAASMALRLD